MNEPFGSEQKPAQGPQTAPPGWYPTDNGWQRYWDGGRWTEHQAPLVPQVPSASNDRGLAVLAHLGGAFITIFVPLILFIVKKDESPYVRHHAAEALNFQLSFLLAFFVSFILIFVIIGLLLLPVLFVTYFVFAIIASVAANRGEWYRYPMIIRFVS